MCTEPMAVRPYVYEWTIYSSTAVVVVYALHIMVFGVSPSECVGWYKWALLPLWYTTLFVSAN